MVDKILKLVTAIFDWLAEFVIPEVPVYPDNEPTPEEHLLAIAEAYLGTDASPLDEAPDWLGCADSLSLILGEYTNGVFPHTLSTIRLHEYLENSSSFKRTLNWEKGYIVVVPTEGRNIGHCWVLGDANMAMSNSSNNGKWEYNYGYYDIIKNFVEKKRLVPYVYKPLEINN